MLSDVVVVDEIMPIQRKTPNNQLIFLRESSLTILLFESGIDTDLSIRPYTCKAAALTDCAATTAKRTLMALGPC